jgi:hypothetical protein
LATLVILFSGVEMCTLETVLAGPVDRESYSSTFEIATVDIQEELIHVKIEIAPPLKFLIFNNPTFGWEFLMQVNFDF